MPRTLLLITFILVVLTLMLGACQTGPSWNQAEKDALRALWIGSLPPLPPDPSNAVADDPRAVALGHKLFFDTRLSSNGKVACATCHLPELMFQDGKPLAEGVGTTNRKTMTIIGTAYSPWLFWDGRKDSQWAQALGPLESPVEHGGSRMLYAHLVARRYKGEYEALFGPMPDFSDTKRFPATGGPVADPVARAAWDAMSSADREAVTRVYANIGKAIAAYERKIMPGFSRFDTYVKAVLNNEKTGLQALTADEIAGLKLFIGKAECTKCHNGPLLTNNDFHNTGVPGRAGLPEDLGRASGAPDVLKDEFNCLSPYSDAGPEGCQELRFMNATGHELEAAFKPSSLRNIEKTAPYMHAGQFATLREVLDHYNQAKPGLHSHTELKPLSLSNTELTQLEAFLRSLNGPLNTPPELLRAPQSYSSSGGR